MSRAATKLPAIRGEKPRAMAAWNPFDSLHQQIDDLFDGFGAGFWPPVRTPIASEPGWAKTVWATPAMDVVEKDKSYEISAELPGLSDKDVEIHVANGVLTIQGEKREAKEEEKQGYYLSERRYGSFARSFHLPDGADPDKIEAQFKNGVLTVVLPKSAEAQKSEKKIAIKAA
jgi:HSP20 family protein